MAGLEQKIIVSNSEMRPCMVLGVKALFHRWVEREDIILKLNRFVPFEKIEELKREYKYSGFIPRELTAEKTKTLSALVEYEDGTVGEVQPENIRFLDSPHNKYDFTERAENKNDKNHEKAEFACHVCFEKLKRDNPSARDCAWRGIDNEYCPELKKILEREAAGNV